MPNKYIALITKFSTNVSNNDYFISFFDCVDMRILSDAQDFAAMTKVKSSFELYSNIL